MIVWLRQVVVALELRRIPFGSLILTLDFGLFVSMLPNWEIELGDLLIREASSLVSTIDRRFRHFGDIYFNN